MSAIATYPEIRQADQVPRCWHVHFSDGSVVPVMAHDEREARKSALFICAEDHGDMLQITRAELAA